MEAEYLKVSIFDKAQTVTETEFYDDLSLLPEWRKKKALSYRFLIDRVLCTKAYLLLKKSLADVFDINCDFEFDFVKHGKPVIREYPDIHFNISHCKNGVMCVVDKEPVGCDIEEIKQELDMKICRYCFNEKEIEKIVSAENPCVEFVKFWTIKEAVLKLTGEGINEKLPSLLTDELIENIQFKTKVCLEKGYVYTICKYK